MNMSSQETPVKTVVHVNTKPVTKLLDMVEKAVGAVASKWLLRRAADAEAYRIREIADARAYEAEIMAKAEDSIAIRTQQRVLYQEELAQRNLEDIFHKTQLYLGLKETVSEEPVDKDWFTRFIYEAKTKSNNEVQEFWAKILADEIEKPGSISVRTLSTLSNLSGSEAKMFEKLVSIVVENGYVIQTKGLNDFERFGILPYEIIYLRSAGMILVEDSLTLKITKNEIINGFELRFGEQIIKIKKDEKYASDFLLPVIGLTVAGSEISKSIEPNIYKNNAYFKELNVHIDRFLNDNTVKA